MGLLTDIEQVRLTMNTAYERQLDLVIMFMAGLLGNLRTRTFLDSLDVKPTVSLDDLIKLVVDRERRNEASIESVDDKSTAHKESTLLLLMLIYESRHAELWRHISNYVLDENKGLDLQGQHITPTELEALVYVLPNTGITSLE